MSTPRRRTTPRKHRDESLTEEQVGLIAEELFEAVRASRRRSNGGTDSGKAERATGVDDAYREFYRVVIVPLLACWAAIAQVVQGYLFPSVEELERRRTPRKQGPPRQDADSARGSAGYDNASSEGSASNGSGANSEERRREDTPQAPGVEREDPFEVLGLPRGGGEGEGSVTESDVNRAYRKLALRWHPDKVKSDEDKPHAEAMMSRLNIAKALALKQLLGDDDAADAAGSDDDDIDAGSKSPGKHRGYAGPSEEEEEDWRKFASKRKREKKRLARERNRAAKRGRESAAKAFQMRTPAPFEEPYVAPSGEPDGGTRSDAGSTEDTPHPPRTKTRGGMEECTHDAACAIRVQAHIVIAEVLAFEMAGPLERLDEYENTVLHYAAYYGDASTCEQLLQMVGSHWRAVLLATNAGGETPLDLARNVGASAACPVRARLESLQALVDAEARRQERTLDSRALAHLLAAAAVPACLLYLRRG